MILKPGTKLFLVLVLIGSTATFALAQPSEPRIASVRPNRIEAVAFRPDGKVLASGSRAGNIKIWDPDTGKCTATLAGDAGVFFLVYSPDGKTLFSACGNKITLWDTATGKRTASFNGHKALVRSLAISPDGKRLVSVSGIDDGRIKFWDSVTFSPDGKTLATAGGWDGTIKLWDSATGKPIATLGPTNEKRGRRGRLTP